MERQLSGDGLTLRLWQAGDQEALLAIIDASREQFSAWLPNALTDLADLSVFLGHVASTHREQTAWFYAIEDGGEPVGQCSLHDRGGGEAEIGYWVRTDRTGRGLATRAVLAVAAAALAHGYDRLVIQCDEGNRRSASVARKAGFIHVGTVDLDPRLPRTSAQTGREMTWVRSRNFLHC
jgi:RimJ/RimL family protein N-acetyltransferase